ncbi:MAG: DUF4870 domain-containing protein [Glaciecola sp.]
MSTADNSTHFTVATQSKDAKNTSMVMWLASVFLGVFAGLIFGFMQKEQPYVQQQAKQAINFGITLLIASVVVSVLFGTAFLTVLGLVNVLFALMGAIATSQGANYVVPVSLKLLK